MAVRGPYNLYGAAAEKVGGVLGPLLPLFTVRPRRLILRSPDAGFRIILVLGVPQGLAAADQL